MSAIEPDHEVLIVGAGFAGMAAAIKLRDAGFDDFLILERAGEVGGTWRDNTYPGVAVDIPSFTYSFHFEPNPGWSRIYAPGRELLDYARHCADKYRLRKRIRFNAEVVEARFDEDAHLWRLELADGGTVTGRFLFSCHGQFATAQRPTIPGLADFTGSTIYTMAWDHELDLTGRRVAVIGTGASALQVIPAIAPEVKSLDVYQRTAIWVLPKADAQLGRLVRAAFDRVPLARWSVRAATSALSEAAVTFGAVYHQQLPFAVKGVEQLCRAHLRRQVPDRTLRAKLTPSYGFGCKRPSFSNTYYPAFLRDNVELITDGIERITPTGIRTVTGEEREIDVLVLATGFTVFDVPYALRGTSGEPLNDRWRRDRKHTYEGVTVHGYPNLFLNPGPYGVAGPSLFATFELCTTHAVRVLREARRRGATRVEISKAAQQRFLDTVRGKVGHTMFLAPTCAGSNSYYIDEHGDSPYLRPTSGLHAWWAQHRFPLDDYAFDTRGSRRDGRRRQLAAVARSGSAELVCGRKQRASSPLGLRPPS
ncbi:MAG TPA: NAD(P)/FAD-dependent oxidoreductase [Pseudonocardia sp.]|nr:NAD(P)/FAD-dependent oxidoreductase [Pseudonocardia sp.]